MTDEHELILYHRQSTPEADRMVHVCQKQDFTIRELSWLQGHQCHSNVSHRES